jgi:hypothetical protein
MSIPTVNVTVIVNGQDGLPVEGALVSAKLDREDRYNGFVVKKTVSGKTDATGTLVLPLWPNALGTNSSQYLVNIRTKEQTKRYTAYVPNENCVLTSIVDLEPAPALSVAQIVLRDANEARVRAEAAVAEASDFADAASASAATAGASSDAAGGYASAAEASAEGAAAAVDGVVESVADLAAGASASAAAAEAAAEAAAISAEQAASVSDITSHAGTTASVAVLGHVRLASAAPTGVSSTAATGVASTVARSDHAHALGAHAASHAAGQPDAISPASIGAAPASHVSDTSNPHAVTAAQAGAAPASHATDTANPHAVTAAQAGAVAASLLTTAGDLIVATAANTPARLGIGSEGQALKVVSGVPAWGDVASGFIDTSSEISITGAITLTSTAFGKMHVCSGTSIDYTVGLPAASGNAGKLIGIRIANACTKLVTIDANSSESIDEVTTRVMWAGESAILLCDGVGWTKIAGKFIPMLCKISANAVQSIPTGAWTKFRMDVDIFDNSNLSNLSNSSILIRRNGYYDVMGQVMMLNNINFYERLDDPIGATVYSYQSLGGIAPISATHYAEAGVEFTYSTYHQAGSSQSTWTAPYPYIQAKEVVSW